MFGVPLNSSADVFCDNCGLVMNASKPESILQKKHNTINYDKILLDDISANISFLVHKCKYGAINKTDAKTMVSYVIKYVSDMLNYKKTQLFNVKLVIMDNFLFRQNTSVIR